CVGLGYGPYTHIARGFSRQYRITNFTKKAPHHALALYKRRIYLSLGLHAYTNNPLSGMATSLCHPIAWTTRSAEHTSELLSRSLPSRRSSDLLCRFGVRAIYTHR